MNVQFEWQAGSEDGQWETIAKTERRHLLKRFRKVPWWGWGLLILGIAALAIGGCVVVRDRYEGARRRIAFQIQNVIDLEARAYAARDRELFLAQQDDAAPDWYARQELLIDMACVSSPPWGEGELVLNPCAPTLPAEVQNVRMRGDVALVEVIEDEPPLRRARFYRRTEQGWKHTAPRVEFWGVAIELHYGDMLFRYHRWDQPYVDPLVEHIAEVFYDLCATADCTSSGGALEVNFVVQGPASADGFPRLEGNELLLASPWLSGIPLEGTWSEAHLHDLTYWVEHAVASLPLRPTFRSGRV